MRRSQFDVYDKAHALRPYRTTGASASTRPAIVALHCGLKLQLRRAGAGSRASVALLVLRPAGDFVWAVCVGSFD